MENNTQDPDSQNSMGLVRRWMLLPVIVLSAGILFLAGRYVYSLGQRASSTFMQIEVTSTTPVEIPLPLDPTVTPTPVPPTSTSWVFPPTATATKIPWTSCPGIVVTRRDEKNGDFLHVLRCEDGLEYDIGPLSTGVYAVAPNDKYLVYCDLNGILYAARIGSPALTIIKKTEREFFVFGRNVDPWFELSFVDPYVLEVYESRYAQNLPVDMPRWLSE